MDNLKYIFCLLLIVGCAKPSTVQKSNIKPQPVAQIQPKTKDTDGDGVPDHLDACANSKEDYDSYHDDDGCPDLDHDNDGINEPHDKCPTIKGDRADGCLHPNIDRDNDGIVNSADKCPDMRESYNFIQDLDGCPDGKVVALLILPMKCDLARERQFRFEFKKGSALVSNIEAVKQKLRKMKKRQYVLLRIFRYGHHQTKPSPLVKARVNSIVVSLRDAGVKFAKVELAARKSCTKTKCKDLNMNFVQLYNHYQAFTKCPKPHRVHTEIGFPGVFTIPIPNP